MNKIEKVIRAIIVTALLLIGGMCIAEAQNTVSFGIYQDGKLAVMNDNHGNTPFTTDVTITSNWEGNQKKYHYFALQPFFEYADLETKQFKPNLSFGVVVR